MPSDGRDFFKFEAGPIPYRESASQEETVSKLQLLYIVSC